MVTLKPLCTSSHHFHQAKALPSHSHPDSSLTQRSKEKQSCLNTTAFNPSVNRIAEFSLKQAKYSFSDLQDSKTEEESKSSDTYHVSSRTGYMRTEFTGSNHCLFASGTLFWDQPEHSPNFLPHMEHWPDCVLSEAPALGQGWDCDALRVVSPRCHPVSPQTLNIQHSVQVTSSVYQREKADSDEKKNFPLKITVP